MSVNKVILIGRLGKDPETRDTSGGGKLCKFSIATDRPVGQGKEKITDWHNVVTFGKTAELCARYLSKGREVYIEGRIEYSKVGDGADAKYFTNVVANEIKFLGDGSGQGSSSDSPAPARGAGTYTPPPADEDIPF